MRFSPLLAGSCCRLQRSRTLGMRLDCDESVTKGVRKSHFLLVESRSNHAFLAFTTKATMSGKSNWDWRHLISIRNAFSDNSLIHPCPSPICCCVGAEVSAIFQIKQLTLYEGEGGNVPKTLKIWIIFGLYSESWSCSLIKTRGQLNNEGYSGVTGLDKYTSGHLFWSNYMTMTLK